MLKIVEFSQYLETTDSSISIRVCSDPDDVCITYECQELNLPQAEVKLIIKLLTRALKEEF